MRLNQGLLTCHGDYDPEAERCHTCPMKETCMDETNLFNVPDSVWFYVKRREDAEARAKRWLDRTSRFMERYGYGVRVKRALSFGELRRGLVLRKRMEEMKR